MVSLQNASRWLIAAVFAFSAGAVAAQGLPPAPNTPIAYVAMSARGSMAPAISCADLAHHDFSGVKDGPASVTSAEIEPAKAGRAEFCLVKGYVAANIHFELRLPTAGYTGRYLQIGCGGSCGYIMPGVMPVCDNQPAFGGAFAVGAEDSGHSGRDGVFAMGGQDARIDFGYRAAHAFAQAAKAITAAYYGQPPAYSYFEGCSDGGREALAETERYPTDFNGVIAGSPAFDITEAMERFIWESRWGHDDAGKLILDPPAITALHAAVMDACDGLDGLKDGQIDEPRACHFDPRTIICKAPGQAGCLTPQQADTATKLYDGPRDANGVALFTGGEAYGSELSWMGQISLINAGSVMLHDQGGEMIFVGALPADISPRTWKFDLATFHDLSQRGAIYDANDPDLRPFRNAGGKLILWHGAADPAAGPNGVEDYYQRLRNVVGGLPAAQTFARLFVVPGVYHCFGGYMPYEEDYLGAMVAWVEAGQAPDKVVATAALPAGGVRTRPVYAYPTRAKYVGHGDINDAASFSPAPPLHMINDLYDWAGAPGQALSRPECAVVGAVDRQDYRVQNACR